MSRLDILHAAAFDACQLDHRSAAAYQFEILSSTLDAFAYGVSKADILAALRVALEAAEQEPVE